MAKLKKNDKGYFTAWYHGKQFRGKTEPEAKAKRNQYKYECEHGIEKQEPITVLILQNNGCLLPRQEHPRLPTISM